jgi:hypothetical protein
MYTILVAKFYVLLIQHNWEIIWNLVCALPSYLCWFLAYFPLVRKSDLWDCHAVCVCVFDPFSFWTSWLISITFWCQCCAIVCHPNLVLLISLNNKNMVGAHMRSEVMVTVLLNVWCGCSLKKNIFNFC